MSHLREQIRKQIITQITGLTLTGTNVFDSHVYQLDQAALPAITIFSQAEGLEQSNLSAPRDMDRVTEFIISAYAKGETGYQDTIDSIAAEIEAALSTDLTVNGLAKDIVLLDVAFDYQAGDQPIAKMDMTYNVMYRTKENNAEVAT